jgi:cation-dependent mannose-6-phosphate receptor
VHVLFFYLHASPVHIQHDRRENIPTERATVAPTATAMKLLYYSLALYLSVDLTAAASRRESTEKPPAKPCTITSPTTGRLFDLSGLQVPRPDSVKSKNPRTHSWNATGYDIGYNFTLNICGPVIEPIKDVVGIEEHLWKNVSAYYKHSGKFYSLGYVRSLGRETLLRNG